MMKWVYAMLVMLLPLTAQAQELGTVNFAFDSAELDDEARAKISEISDQLKSNPSYKPTVVIGFTDAVGSNPYNDELGLRRARAVSDALVAAGVQVDGIGDVESRGKRQLLVSVAGPERQNRRVTVSLGDILGACRSYREIPLTTASVGEELQTDIEARLSEARRFYNQLATSARNGAAFQMAGAAEEDCKIAAGYETSALRKVEYSQKCFCSSARMRVAMQ